MPTFTLTESGGTDGVFTEIPADEILDLTVMEITEVVKPWLDDDGKEVRKVSFKFRIDAGSFKGRFVWGETPTTFSTNENCKLRNWAQEILGVELPAGFQLDTDMLLECPVRGVTAQRPKKDGGQHTYVLDLMRTKDNLAAEEEPF